MSKTRDRFLFDLNEDYALMRDDLQWIIARRQKDRLRPVKFDRRGREGVFLCLRQLKSEPTPEALRMIFERIPSAAEVSRRERAEIRRKLTEAKRAEAQELECA